MELHICPKCNQSSGWNGPPYRGKLGKLKALVFHLKRRTLFSKDFKKYPFVRCNTCGYVVNGEEYSKLTRRIMK